MITLTGFADEIDERLDTQILVLKKLNMTHLECRGIDGKPLISYPLTQVEGFKRKLDEAGIKLSAVGSSIGKISITDDFEPHFELFRHAVEIAKLMDTPNIRIFSFFIPQNAQPEQYHDKVMHRLDRLSNYAEKHNVILLHENEKEIYGDTALRCLEIMKHFYGPHFQAVFDFANFVQCGQDTLEAWEILKPYVSYIHVKDAKKATGNVVPAGMGDGHLEEILYALKESGYHGYLSLEPHLSDFTGFHDLEHDTRKEHAYTGEESFTIAYQALTNILKRLDFKTIF